MNVFVAGGTGAIGRRVVRRLLDQGHHVACLARSAENHTQLVEMGAEPRAGDLFDEHSVEGITADRDVILHLATAIPTRMPSRVADWKINDRIRTEGSENLIRAAIVNKCKALIAQSITYVYGNQHGAWVDEHTPRAQQLGPLLQSVLQMESLLDVARTHAGLPTVTLRFGMFYGADLPHTQATLEMIQRGKFPILGDGDTWWNLIHIDDAARAVVAAVAHYERNIGEAINVVDDTPVLQSEYVSGLAELLEASKPWHLPLWMARLRFGSAILEPLLLSTRCANKKARQQLQWQPHYPDFRYGHQGVIHAWRGDLSPV